MVGVSLFFWKCDTDAAIDIMMFAVVAVAITCLAFCWTICVVAFHGWLKTRTNSAVSYHSAA